jgi:hypothetical protein
MTKKIEPAKTRKDRLRSIPAGDLQLVVGGIKGKPGQYTTSSGGGGG